MKHRHSFLFTGLLWLLVLAPGWAQRRMENLGRGVVAVRTGTNVFISWRLLGLDPAGLGFNLYRTAGGGTPVKLNPAVLTAGTNYTDNTANLAEANAYYVKPVLNGVEQAASGTYTLAANTAAKPCFTVPLRPGNKMHFAWVGDLDGDGEYDYVVDRKGGTPVRSTIEAYKRDGTFLWEVNYGPNSENDDNIEPGSSSIATGNWDGVTVYDLDGDGKAEVISKIANGVVLGNGTVFTDASNDKQWIAVLDGQTGALRSTVAVPQDYISDGPMASSLGIGYLNGSTPSVIAKFKNRQSRAAGNGFNMMICAFSFTGTTASMQWQWNRGTSGEADGHQIRIADVDQNGTDEILDIGFCLNGDGTLRYSLKNQGIIHGDRTQIGKLDPNRPGLQGYGVQQNNTSFLYEYYFDANTGQVLWKHFGSKLGDVGRGAAGDIDPRYSGVEVWAFDGVHNGPSNTRLTTTAYPYPNFRIWWDGDLLAENLHNEMIDKWNYTTSRSSRLVTAYRFDNANAGDRDAPLFYGDILGDWREEVLFASSDNSKLVVFTTDNATSTRLYTLAHNPAYRNGMTIKGYMQSHWTDYFLGDGMTTPPAPAITYAQPTSIQAQYQTGDLGQPTDGQIRPFLQLVNTGATAIPYSSLTVRYWLTAENFAGQLVTPIDWAKLGTGFVSARYVALPTPRQGALGYIEYSFAAGAGSLAAGTDSGPIYGKAYQPSYANFNEANDWSYQASGSFTANDHVTLYQNGTLLAGTEPPAVAATTSLRVYAGNQDTSPSTSYLNLTLQVGNVGTRPVNYSDLTVRYYFTRDGATSLVPQVDYAKLGASNISVRYVPLATQPNGADGYLEIGFSAALGALHPLGTTGNIQVKLRKDDYTAFTQPNDYSFGNSSAVVEQPRVPAYLNGVLAFGTEPDQATASAARGSQPASTSASVSAGGATIVAAGGGPQALTASPNPFGEQLTLRFALPTTQAYTLALYDGQGRLVRQLASGEAPAEQPQAVALPTATYATGLYLVRLTTASGVQTLKLVKQ